MQNQNSKKIAAIKAALDQMQQAPQGAEPAPQNGAEQGAATPPKKKKSFFAGIAAFRAAFMGWCQQKMQAVGSGSTRERFERFFFDTSIDPVELEFMSEADAAIYRHGRPKAYVISLAVLLLFMAVILWAALTRLDEVTKAQGQVVPAQAIQEIQYHEGGVLESIMVKPGEEVEEGQVLARISNVLAQSTLQEQKDNQAQLEAEVLRLRAEIDGVEPVFNDNLVKNYPHLIAGEMALYDTHLDQRRTELRSLEAELEQRRREVQESEARLRSITANLTIARQRRDLAAPLVQKGTYSRMDFMGLEQNVASLEGDLAQTTQSISRSKSAVTAAEEKINARRLEWQSSLQEDLNKKSAALSSVTTLLTARGDTVKRTDLRSPVKGQVKRILLNTVGGSVPPGGTIMEILPTDDKLLIEARVSPQDRAFLHTSDDPAKKQRAIIKVSSYDFTIYGGLDATLEWISSDTYEDNRGEIYYQIQLLTTSNAIHYGGKSYEILPGMTAQVDIITGKKTVLSYLLKPILRAKQNALRER
ncbi:HlyD family type I secretion periplasmic adaptor subunit [Desulfovibrio sp. OttesenSCG-928-F07]|nr:HlyD family type I secretion periplasmic adaptor subunit [Desulfovibrio sp. OttesenSCG-928-F07]